MEKRSNIAIFSYAYHPLVGGAELAAKEITDRIPKRHFICFTNHFGANTPPEERIGNVDVVRVGSGIPYHMSRFEKMQYVFLAWRAAERKHQKEPFNVVWAIMASYGAVAALLFKICHPRIPLLLTLQEGDSETHILKRVGWWYPVWRMLFGVSEKIQVISASLRDFAIRQGAKSDRIHIVPNGVDLEKFSAGGGSSSGGKEKRNEKIIITTSRLVKKNGVDILIRAFAILAEHSPEYRLRILGNGPERDTLERLAGDLGVSDGIEFLGHVAPERIPEELSRADVFVRASRSEGLGSSFLEAMAAGLPIVGTDVGGIKDFLKDRETGLVVRSEDPEDVVAKIATLFTEPGLRERMVKNGLALVREKYSWDRVAGEMEKIFTNLLRSNIIVATGIFPPAIGGPATYAQTLVDFQTEIRIDPLTVVTYGEATKGHSRLIVVPLSYPKGIRHLIYAWKLGKAALLKNTIIYAVDSSLAAAGVARIAAALTGAKLIVRVTGDYAWEQGRQRFGVTDGIDDFQKRRYGFLIEAFRSATRWVVRGADYIIVPSSYLKNLTIGWGVDAEKISIKPNPVVVYMSSSAAILSRENARKKLGLQGKIILSAGRFVPWKGFKEIIRIFPKIQAEFPDALLVLIGDGPDRKMLEHEASIAGSGGAVRFTGVLPKAELLDWLSGADLFVLNSDYEGLSHQLIQAVGGFGLPAVATDVGGNIEVKEEFPDKVTLVAKGNNDELSSAIVAILKKNIHPTPPAQGAGKFSLASFVRELKDFFATL